MVATDCSPHNSLNIFGLYFQRHRIKLRHPDDVARRQFALDVLVVVLVGSGDRRIFLLHRSLVLRA